MALATATAMGSSRLGDSALRLALGAGSGRIGLALLLGIRARPLVDAWSFR